MPLTPWARCPCWGSCPLYCGCLARSLASLRRMPAVPTYPSSPSMTTQVTHTSQRPPGLRTREVRPGQGLCSLGLVWPHAGCQAFSHLTRELVFCLVQRRLLSLYFFVLKTYIHLWFTYLCIHFNPSSPVFLWCIRECDKFTASN